MTDLEKRILKLEALVRPVASFIELTDEERAIACAAIVQHAGVELPDAFKALPSEEQNRLWHDAIERGDYDPAALHREGSPPDVTVDVPINLDDELEI